MTTTHQQTDIWSKLKKPVITLTCIYGALLVLFIKFPNLLTASAFILLNAALPLILIFFVLFEIKFFKAMEGVGWLKLFWVAGGFLYLVVANKWSGDILNEIFKIDPSFFPTTSKVLTVVGGPLYFYASSEWRWISAYILVTYALLLSILIPAVLISPVMWQALPGNKWLWFVSAFVIVAIWVPMTTLLGAKYPTLVERLAIWADFNDNHRCSNLGLQRGQKVVFLKDGNVLALLTKSNGETEYAMLRCEYVRPAF